MARKFEFCSSSEEKFAFFRFPVIWQFYPTFHFHIVPEDLLSNFVTLILTVVLWSFFENVDYRRDDAIFICFLWLQFSLSSIFPG